MQTFYKYFTLSILSFALMCLVSWLVFDRMEPTVAAQVKADENCRPQNIYVLEDNPNRTVHLVYDFSRGTVSIVQIQKGYTPPEITVRTKNLAQ